MEPTLNGLDARLGKVEVMTEELKRSRDRIEAHQRETDVLIQQVADRLGNRVDALEASLQERLDRLQSSESEAMGSLRDEQRAIQNKLTEAISATTRSIPSGIHYLLWFCLVLVGGLLGVVAGNGHP